MIKQGLHMWGEVFLELKNEKTGLIEQRIHVQNTLMQRFIDYLISSAGYCPGIGIDTTADIRSIFGLNTGNVVVTPPVLNDVTLGNNNGHPELIVFGNSTTPITSADATLNGVIAGTYKNVYTSKEGGSGQAAKDNIYLKVSVTYLTNEANATINNVGLYSTQLVTRADATTAAATYVFPVNNTAWDIYNLCVNYYTGIGNELYTFQHFTNAPAGAQLAYTFNPIAPQTITWYNGPALSDQMICTFVPDISGPFAANIGQYLAGVVLPEPIIKTVNHSLTVIWLIHFDAV